MIYRLVYSNCAFICLTYQFSVFRQYSGYCLIFWFFNREEKDFVLLLNWLNAMIGFYIQEFTFNLKLIIVDDAGHSMLEQGIQKKLIEFTEKFTKY